LTKISTRSILVSDKPILEKSMLPRPTIEAFDRHLLGLGLRFEAVVIGGSALGLMGIIKRPTRDFDILVPELPPAIAECVPWLEVQDGNELWPAHVRTTVADLVRRLGHGV
jgi:hypothetical protein